MVVEADRIDAPLEGLRRIVVADDDAPIRRRLVDCRGGGIGDEIAGVMDSREGVPVVDRGVRAVRTIREGRRREIWPRGVADIEIETLGVFAEIDLANIVYAAHEEEVAIARVRHRRAEDDLDGRIGRRAHRAVGRRTRVDVEVVAAAPGAVGGVQREVVGDRAGAFRGDVLPDGRVRVVDTRACVVDCVPLCEQPLPLVAGGRICDHGTGAERGGEDGNDCFLHDEIP